RLRSVLAHLGDQDARPAALGLLEGLDQLQHFPRGSSQPGLGGSGLEHWPTRRGRRFLLANWPTGTVGCGNSVARRNPSIANRKNDGTVDAADPGIPFA